MSETSSAHTSGHCYCQLITSGQYVCCLCGRPKPADAGRPVPASSPLKVRVCPKCHSEKLRRVVEGTPDFGGELRDLRDIGWECLSCNWEGVEPADSHSAAEGVPRLQAIREFGIEEFMAQPQAFPRSVRFVDKAEVQAELDRLTATCARLEQERTGGIAREQAAWKDKDYWRDRCFTAEAALADLRAQIARLMPYLQHTPVCAYWPHMAQDEREHTYEVNEQACSCGLAALRPAGEP